MLTFTGTPEQVSWKQKIHQVLLLNELGAASPYALSFAGAGKSGYSFGYAQWDLATNPTIRNSIFRDILQNATDANGQYFINDGNPSTERADDALVQTLLALVAQPGGTSLNEAQRSLIDQALSSTYGQNTIDQRHDQHLGEVIVRVDQVIALITNPADSVFLNNEVPKLFLADYENQFKITPGGALEQFLQGELATLGGGAVQKVGGVGTDDLLNFYFSTEYASKAIGNLNDEIRRFNNIVSVTGGLYNLPEDPAAREEEAKGLIRVYQDYLKSKASQLTNLFAFNTAVLEPARVALIAQYVTNQSLGISINGEVVVGEDQSSLARNTKHGSDDDRGLTGTPLNDLILGESGDDILIGGKGDDVLVGGDGFDTYRFSSGDGNDRIVDSDRKGRILFDGIEDKARSGFFLSTGANTWTSADGTVTATLNSPLTITDGSGTTITVDDFVSGDFGIQLVAAPSVPQNPLRTFLGDKQDYDSDASEPGTQTQADAFGNIVRADGQDGRPDIAQPDRADVFLGSTGAEVERFTTGGGNDTVNADGVDSATSTAGGRDLIETGPGQDIVAAGAGDDWIEGGSGADILSGNAGNDVIYADTRGTDPLTDISAAIAAGGGAGTGLQGEWLAGDAGDDILIGGTDNDVLTGGEGLDLLVGGAGADNLLGDSTYVATSLTWSFTDSGGVRLFTPVVGEADPLGGAADEIYGGSGDDFIRGGRGDDVIYGEGDEDDIAGEQGADVIFGGDGNDDLSGDATYIAGAEHGTDYIDGGAGNDRIAGEGGDDVIFGGTGADVILGDGATLDAAFHGSDFIDGGDADDVISAGGGDDILIGGEGADVLVGDTGNDQLEGGSGADILSGGEGDDRYVADASDSIEDDSGANTVTLAEGDGPESWELQETIIGGQPAVVLALAGQTAGLTLYGRFDGFSFEFANGEVLSSGELVYRVATEGRQVLGTAADDVLIGTRFDDRLEGFGGNDTLDGREGSDALLGGEGDDVYVFDPGFGIDRIEEQIGSSFDTVRFGPDITAADVTVARRANGDLVLSLSPQDQLTIAGQYRDGSKIEQVEFGDGVTLMLADLDALPISAIVGTDGPDTLPGTEADDTIEGRGGIDTYSLGYGLGRDTFIDTDGRIVLQTGLDFDELRAIRQGDDLAVLIRGTTEGAILKDYYLAPQSWTIEDTGGAQTTPQAVADATSAREQDWLNAQRDEYRYSLKAQAIGGYLYPGSLVTIVGDGLLHLPWQTSVGATGVTGFGSWTTTDITTTIYSANGTVSVLPFFESDSSWSNFPPFMLDFNVAVENETLVSDDEFIFSTAGLFREEVVDTVVATVAWDRADADQRADNSTITTAGLLPDGGYFTSTARYSSFSGEVGGRVTAFAPVGSVALSSGLFPEHIQAFLTTVDETWRITDVIAGPGNNTIFGAGIDVIDAGAGDDVVNGGGFVYGGEGNDEISADVAIGGPGNDRVFGTRMHGGPGDDYLEGGFGASRFVFDVEDLGRDVVTDTRGLSIEEFAAWYYPSIGIPDWEERLIDPETEDDMSIEQGIALGLLPRLPRIAAHDWSALAPLYAASVIEVDTVEFAQGLAPGDVSLSWGEVTGTSPVSGALEAYTTLDVSWGADNVARIVIPHADDPLGTGVEEFRFADGSVVPIQDMVAAAPPAPSFDPQFGDNVLVGSARGEVILGWAGNDTLVGGPGGDFLEGGEGNDVYVFAQGDGADYVFDEDGADAVRFAAGIAPDDVLVTADPFGALILTLTTGDSVTLANWFTETTRVERVEFEDDTTWDTANLLSRFAATSATEVDDIIAGTADEDVIDGLGGHDQIYGLGGDDVLDGSAGNDYLEGGAGNDEISGGVGDDILYGSGGVDVLHGDEGHDFLEGRDGNDSLYGDAGDDVLSGGLDPSFNYVDGDHLFGGEGNDTFIFGRGYGNDLLTNDDPDPASLERVIFNADLSPSDLNVRHRAGSLSIIVNGTADKDWLFIYDYFSQDGWIDSFEFSDGTIWDLAAVREVVLQGTAGNDDIDGFGDDDTIDGLAGDDFISAAAGNDTLIGGPGDDRLLGGEGDDTYVFNLGDGLDIISDSEGFDTLVFGPGVTADMLSLGLGSLLIRIGDEGDAIHLDDFDPLDAFSPLGIEELRFADGTVVSYGELVAGGFDLIGTAGDDQLTGTSATDRLDGGAGNDTLEGRTGDDTYFYGRGSGADVIFEFDETPGNLDTVSLSADVAPADIEVTRTADHLVLSIRDTPDTLTINNWFVSAAEKIERVQFADGTTWDVATLESIAVVENSAPVLAQPLADLTTTERQGFTFVVPEATFTDADAGDTLAYSAMLATETALPAWLAFDPASRTFSGTPGEYDIGTFAISVTATDPSGAQAADAFNLSVALLPGVTLTGTSGQDNLVGGPGADTISAGAGADTLSSNAGWDVLNGGDGVDQLSGGTGNDTLYGGFGADTMFGDEGADSLYGEVGADTLWGGVGNDLLDGGDGGDTLRGEAGEDLLYGDIGADNLYGGTGNDYLSGGLGGDQIFGEVGTDVLQGGDGADSLFGATENDLLQARLGGDTLDGDVGNDFLAAGGGADTIKPGAGQDVIAFNRNDGSDTVQAAGGPEDTVSVGGGIRYQDLTLSKSNNDLVLDAGSGDRLTFKDWYAATPVRPVLNLQVIAEAMADFNPASTDPLLNRKVQSFDFQGIYGAFEAARAANPALTSWALTNALLDFHLSGSDTEALGGDLAYQYGKNGALTGISLNAAQDVIGSAQFGLQPQALRPLASLQDGLVKLS